MSIQAAHISAFLESTRAVFETMLDLAVTFEKPRIRDNKVRHDVSGIIGLSGDISGAVVVGFSRLAAIQIVAAFTGSRIELDSPDFADAIGELANMIAGGAKAKFEGMDVSIGCPSVIRAPSHHIDPPSEAQSITIPCSTPAGSFSIDVAFRTTAGVSPSARTQATEA